MLAYQICAPINAKRSATLIDFLNGAAISKPSTDVSNVQRWFSKWNFLMKLFRICKLSCILQIQYICKYFMFFLIGGSLNESSPLRALITLLILDDPCPTFGCKSLPKKIQEYVNKHENTCNTDKKKGNLGGVSYINRKACIEMTVK